MTQYLKAVYEDGVFRPLEPVQHQTSDLDRIPNNEPTRHIPENQGLLPIDS